MTRSGEDEKPLSDEGSIDDIEEEIRLRAYYRFLARGPEEGSDIDDWLRAAEEIREGRNQTGEKR
jgi:hypothetical protein